MNLKKALFASAMAAIIGTACSTGTLARISIDEELPETRVQGIGLANALPLNLASMNLDLTSTEAYQSEDFDYVTEVKFRSLAFDITASSTDSETDSFEDGVADNFDFISKLELFIKAEIDGTEQQVRIAYLETNNEQLDSSVSHLVLDIDDVDILDYIEAPDGYEVVVQANGEAPPDDVIFDGTAVYRVGIGFN